MLPAQVNSVVALVFSAAVKGLCVARCRNQPGVSG